MIVILDNNTLAKVLEPHQKQQQLIKNDGKKAIAKLFNNMM